MDIGYFISKIRNILIEYSLISTEIGYLFEKELLPKILFSALQPMLSALRSHSYFSLSA